MPNTIEAEEAAGGGSRPRWHRAGSLSPSRFGSNEFGPSVNTIPSGAALADGPETHRPAHFYTDVLRRELGPHPTIPATIVVEKAGVMSMTAQLLAKSKIMAARCKSIPAKLGVFGIGRAA